MAENLKEMVIVATYISVLDAIVRRKDIDIDDYESRYFCRSMLIQSALMCPTM